MRQRFWLWLMRLAYRKVVIVTQVPDGVPTVRSMDAPCPGYSPRKPHLYDWQDCETDGHYLCGECCHRKVKAPEDALMIGSIHNFDSLYM